MNSPMNNPPAKKQIVMGTVTAYYLPGPKVSKAGNNYLASGKLILDSEGETCDISFMQVYIDGVQTEEMPKLWNDLNLDTIKGKRVAISCSFDKDWTNSSGAVRHQYKGPTDVKFLDEVLQGKPEHEMESIYEREAEAATPTPGILKGIDPNQLRIMRQSTLNYAAILMAPLVKDFATPQLMVERTIQLAGKFLEYVVTGEMPSFSDDAEAENVPRAEDDELGVINLDAEGHGDTW
jgi:hypothetical protein